MLEMQLPESQVLMTSANMLFDYCDCYQLLQNFLIQ